MRMNSADCLIGITVRVNEIVVRKNHSSVRINKMGESVVGIWVLVNDLIGLVVEAVHSVNGVSISVSSLCRIAL